MGDQVSVGLTPEEKQTRMTNAKILMAEINALKNSDIIDRRDYKVYWEQARKISDLFKNMKLFKSDRDRLWAEHNKMCDGVKEMMNHEKAKSNMFSGTKKELILNLIKLAMEFIEGSSDEGALKQCGACLSMAMIVLKGKLGAEPIPYIPEEVMQAFGGEDINIIVLLRDDREECYQRWVDAKNKLDSQWSLKRKENTELYQAWVEKMTAVKSHKEDLIKQNNEKVQKQFDSKSKCEKNLAATSDEEYAAKLRSWIDEHDRRVKSLQMRNEVLVKQIEDITKKISEQ